MNRVNLFITNILDSADGSGVGAAFGVIDDGSNVFVPAGIVQRTNVVAGETYRAAIVPNRNADAIERTPWFAVFIGEKAPDVVGGYTGFAGDGEVIDDTPEPEPEQELTIAEETRELLLNGEVWSLGALLCAMYGGTATYATHKPEYSEISGEVVKIAAEGLLHKTLIYTAGSTKAGFAFYCTNRAALMPSGLGDTQ